MIEGSTDNGDYLVQVSAQVMTRDDSTGGWVPMGGGGLSNVRLCKLSPLGGCSGNGNGDRQQLSPDFYRIKPEYVIHGERIADHTAILDCRLKKDIQYTKANPKWHHWKTDEKRYGLIFERSEDAKAFDQGIRLAVTDLVEGRSGDIAHVDGDEGIFSYMELPLASKDSSSRSASTASTTTSSPGTNSPQSPLNNDPFSFPHSHNNHLHRVHYISSQQAMVRNVHTNGGGGMHPHQQSQQQQQQQHQQQQQPYQPGSPISEKSSPHKSSFDSSSGQDEVWVRSSLDPSSVSGKSDQGLLDCDGSRDVGVHPDVYKEESYVVFNKSKAGSPHEYSYPNLEPAHKPPAQRSSTKKALSSTSSLTTQPYPPLPIKNKPKSKSGVGDGGKQQVQTGARSRLVSPQNQCKHCRELFSMDDNPRGSCEDAPDSVARCIECVTCVSCTSCLMYHCWADEDGEFRHPCSCGPGDPGDPNHCKRWTALTFLSLLFPCLWCYPPLKACHHCGATCGLCGGRHKA